jgi:hypothetical protein
LGNFSNDPNNQWVYDIDTQSDGTIIAVGSFTSYSGVTRNRIVALNPNGTIKTSFSSGTGFDFSVYGVKVLSDDSMIVIGDFTSYSGVSRNSIIKRTSNGAIDNTLNVGTGLAGATAGLHAYGLVQDVDTNIIVVGAFTTYKGVTYNGIVKIDLSGNAISSFDVGSGFNAVGNQRGFRPVITNDSTSNNSSGAIYNL